MIDGPAAGRVIDAGDPPVRRAVVLLDPSGFGEHAYRYYLESVGPQHAAYVCAGEVQWPAEARSQIIKRLSDQRAAVADAVAPGAALNGD